MKIDGKRVLITGASSGLGEALAWGVASRGGRSTLASRRVAHLRALSAQIKTRYPRLPMPAVSRCDVSDRTSVAGATRHAAREMGGIDILFNNAGISIYGEVERTLSEDIEELMKVNFLGCVHGMKEVLPFMKQEGRGHIVNIASLAALHGVPYLGAYGASKAALAVFSQSLRAELGSSGIQVQVVYPGYTQTPIFESEKKLGKVRRPRPPYASVDEVARTILNAVERDEQETILTFRGKAMAALHGILPRTLDGFMSRLAVELKESEVSSDA